MCSVQAWLCLPRAVQCIWRTVQHPALYFLPKPGSSVLSQHQQHMSHLHLRSLLMIDSHPHTLLLLPFILRLCYCPSDIVCFAGAISI